MSRFIQLHLLTSYPPANLNRDDLGRPKTAMMGGKERLRISSQCLKRHWRTSDVFQGALAGHIGTRTKEMGPRILEALLAADFKDKDAEKATKAIIAKFGEAEGAAKKFQHKQLVHYSPEEREAVDTLVGLLITEQRQPIDAELDLLRKDHQAVDIAMFGRMLAKNVAYNTEAAVQVAHAITVHEVAIEDDFFSALDDANDSRVDFFAAASHLSAHEPEDAGAGHLGETEFGAGLFYQYLCIDAEQLVKNLGDSGLARKAARALTEAAATVAPSGKQNSFGSRAYASYLLAEAGNRQPRSLSVAFLKPVRESDLLDEAIKVLEDTRARIDAAYGSSTDGQPAIMNVHAGEGTLQDVLDFVANHIPETDHA